jgi:hypothetical protein
MKVSFDFLTSRRVGCTKNLSNASVLNDVFHALSSKCDEGKSNAPDARCKQ